MKTSYIHKHAEKCFIFVHNYWHNKQIDRKKKAPVERNVHLTIHRRISMRKKRATKVFDRIYN